MGKRKKTRKRKKSKKQKGGSQAGWCKTYKCTPPCSIARYRNTESSALCGKMYKKAVPIVLRNTERSGGDGAHPKTTMVKISTVINGIAHKD